MCTCICATDMVDVFDCFFDVFSVQILVESLSKVDPSESGISCNLLLSINAHTRWWIRTWITLIFYCLFPKLYLFQQPPCAMHFKDISDIASASATPQKQKKCKKQKLRINRNCLGSCMTWLWDRTVSISIKKDTKATLLIEQTSTLPAGYLHNCSDNLFHNRETC